MFPLIPNTTGGCAALIESCMECKLRYVENDNLCVVKRHAQVFDIEQLAGKAWTGLDSICVTKLWLR